MNVMVTGGAGYIGSHAVKALLAAGHHVVVLDNLERGHEAAVRAAAGKHKVPLETLDLRDTDAIASALTYHQIDGVMHFAALAYVNESVTDPLVYYDNNTAGTVSLLQAMDRARVDRLVFSSTCATYGEPERVPIAESTPQSPINPYGWSKLFVERVLIDFAASRRGTDRPFSFAALRYFNVAGSAADGVIGEDHHPETHLIPVLLNVALGKREGATIFGDDYPTPDGTCIRDYIHVEDLVDAHIHVLSTLDPATPGRDEMFFNLGIGEGKSVREVVEAVRTVTGHDIPTKLGDRRAGDPPALYADASKIQQELGWRAKVTSLETMVETAWRWFRTHPNGYDDA